MHSCRRGVVFVIFFLMIRRPPRSTLFPYTTALPIFKDWFRYESHFVHGRDSLVDILKERGLLSTMNRSESGSAGMPRPISYAVFCLKKKITENTGDAPAAV